MDSRFTIDLSDIDLSDIDLSDIDLRNLIIYGSIRKVGTLWTLLQGALKHVQVAQRAHAAPPTSYGESVIH